MGLVEKLMQSGPALREQILDESVTLLEAEVDSKGGLTGVAIKGAYALFKKFKPGMVRATLDHFLEGYLEGLEPIYADFQKSGSKDVSAYFQGRSHDVAQALLTVTDAKVEGGGPNVRALKSAYNKLRPMAFKHVEAGVPRLSQLLAKYA